jgi:hypothetical protein
MMDPCMLRAPTAVTTKAPFPPATWAPDSRRGAAVSLFAISSDSPVRADSLTCKELHDSDSAWAGRQGEGFESLGWSAKLDRRAPQSKRAKTNLEVGAVHQDAVSRDDGSGVEEDDVPNHNVSRAYDDGVAASLHAHLDKLLALVLQEKKSAVRETAVQQQHITLH